MRSVADGLREDTRRRIAAMSPEARVTLALELGDADVEALAASRGINTADAKAVIARSRRIGRQPSVANDD